MERCEGDPVRIVLACALAIATACGSRSASTPAPLARCANARPQPEIDFALARPAPFEPRSAAISCIANAVSDPPSFDRSYQLNDGRPLHLYERSAALPPKPTQAPLARGTAEVAGASWRITVLDFPAPVLELALERSDLFVELDLPMRDRDADFALLRSIAATMTVH